MIANKYIRCFLDYYLSQVLLIAFFFVEAFGKVCYYYSGELNYAQKYVKGIVILFLIGWHIKERKIFIINGVLILSIIFFSNQLLIDNISIANTILFIKYCFPIILLSYFHFNPQSIDIASKFIKSFNSIILLNSILICLAFIFDLKIFKTYGGNRFGFNGLFITGATSTYVYIIYLITYFSSLKTKVIFTWKELIIFSAVLLVGTKSIYLALFFLLIYRFYKSKNKFKYYYIFSVFLLGVVIFYIHFFETGIFNDIRKGNNLITSILSYRDQLLIDEIFPFMKSKWILINYLIGGSAYGLKSEMGFFDLFFFFGVIGLVIYLFYFSKVFFTYINTMEKSYYISILFLIIFLSGNFFYNATLPIYLLLIKEYFLIEENV